MLVYDSIVAVARAKQKQGYLQEYADDLFVHDRKTLNDAKLGDQFLWILRDCGTGLFPIGVGHDPLWATYWLDQGNSRANPSLVYLLTVGAATNAVMPIDYDRARKFAAIPHPRGRRFVQSLADLGSYWIEPDGRRTYLRNDTRKAA
jgi:hypothetical protein